MIRVIDLFSGIGGFSLGLERAGPFETVQFVEQDAKARQVLTKHWPNVPQHDDIRTYQPNPGDADLVCGGFPCQDISSAGRGVGIIGERSGLWSEMARVIGAVRPRWVIAENVSALRSKGLALVLQDLCSLGYDAEWHCIPASAVGAPHRRDRVWVIAYRNSDGDCQPALSVDDEASRVSYPSSSNVWTTDPPVHRMADGLSGRMDRLKQLGNSVVPQIPELIGRAILQRHQRRRP